MKTASISAEMMILQTHAQFEHPKHALSACVQCYEEPSLSIVQQLLDGIKIEIVRHGWISRPDVIPQPETSPGAATFAYLHPDLSMSS